MTKLRLLFLLLLPLVAFSARAQTTILGGKTLVRSEICLTGAVTGINPDGTVICGASGAAASWQNQGTALGVPNVVNCLTNLTCSIVGSTLTISATGGSMVFPGGTGIPQVTGGAAWGTTLGLSGTGSVCMTTNCAMTTPNMGTPSAINLTNATGAPTWNQSTTGNAATATTLAAGPTTCSAGNAPLGILASGNATGCAPFLSNPMTTIGDMIGGGASGAPTRIVGGKTGQVPVAINGAPPAMTSPGVADGNSGAAVTTTPYPIACDSSTTLLDRVTTLRFQSGASVINAPDHTATGCGGNMAFTLIDDGAGTLTVNRGGSDTFTIVDGSTNTDGATSFTLASGQYATLNNGAAGIWEVRKVATSGGSGITALTGDVTATGPGSAVATIANNAVTGAKMANNTVTAAQLAAQYSKGSCTELWGGSGTSFALSSGDDAISNNSCFNDSGVTRTITAVKCRSNIASNTTTVNPTFGSTGTGTTILSGALTCGSSLAYSSSGTVSNASWTTGTGVNPAMGGTLTGTSIAMIVEYTF